MHCKNFVAIAVSFGLVPAALADSVAPLPPGAGSMLAPVAWGRRPGRPQKKDRRSGIRRSFDALKLT